MIPGYLLSSIILLLSFTTLQKQGKAKSFTRDLLYYSTECNTVRPVNNPSEWNLRRSQILDSMQLVMGPLPAVQGQNSPAWKTEGESFIDGIRVLKIFFEGDDKDMIPALLLIPESLTKPVPGILCLHQTTAIGKNEPAGLGGNPNLHYALELAKMGYVALAPDYPNFGDYTFNPYTAGYKSATMKGIINNIRAVDLLQSLPEADPDRIACIGHSLGGHNSLFLAAFDKRIKVVVTSCGFTSFFKYYNGDLTGWSHKGYMPLIAEKYGRNPSMMPFDFSEVLAAIAPRSVFINAPLHDDNFDISGVKDCIDAAQPVFDLFGAGRKLVIQSPDAPHDFPEEVRFSAYRFITVELGYSEMIKH